MSVVQSGGSSPGCRGCSVGFQSANRMASQLFEYLALSRVGDVGDDRLKSIGLCLDVSLSRSPHHFRRRLQRVFAVRSMQCLNSSAIYVSAEHYVRATFEGSDVAFLSNVARSHGVTYSPATMSLFSLRSSILDHILSSGCHTSSRSGSVPLYGCYEFRTLVDACDARRNCLGLNVDDPDISDSCEDTFYLIRLLTVLRKSLPVVDLRSLLTILGIPFNGLIRRDLAKSLLLRYIKSLRHSLFQVNTNTWPHIASDELKAECISRFRQLTSSSANTLVQMMWSSRSSSVPTDERQRL